MPKRARSDTIVDFIEPALKIQRIGTIPDSRGAEIDILTEAVDSMETTPLQRTNAIYQSRSYQNNSQEADTDNTQVSEPPVLSLVFSLPSEGGTSGEPTPSTIIVATQSSNEQSSFESQLTGDSIEWS